jgi:hypothetical protein
VKLKKIAALILTAALLLCSCGSPDVFNISRKDAETNAELISQKAKDLFREAKKNDCEFTHSLYIGVLRSGVNEMPRIPDEVDGDYVETALSFLSEGKIGGAYAVYTDDDGDVKRVLWSPSLNSELVVSSPDNRPDEEEDLSISAALLQSFGRAAIDAEELTETANANAKLVFQNAATYMTKVQIAGAILDSYIYSGSLNSTYEEFPEVRPVDELTGTDVTNAMRYYMGGEDGGVYVILLDKQYNPLGALWAANTETPYVGAFPISRTVEDNESGSIETADVYAAAGVN